MQRANRNIIVRNIRFDVISILILLIIVTVTAIPQEISFPIQSDSSPRFSNDVCFYKGSEGYTQLELYYSVALKELQLEDESSGKLATFAVNLEVKDLDNKIVFTKSFRKRLLAGSQEDIQDETKGAIDQIIFDMNPGKYRLSFKIKDEVADQESEVSAALYVPDFAESLSMSTPQLAALISSDLSQKLFIKGNKSVIPNTSRKYRYNQSMLYLYQEVYNLLAPTDASNKHFQFSYLISNSKGDSLIFIPAQTIAKPGTSCIKTQTLDIRGLEPGEYEITVAVTDPAANQSISKSQNFWIYEHPEDTKILPMTEKDIKKYRDQIRYFASERELETFDKLDKKGKETFLISFWNQRDTSPETPENEFMQDAFSRIEYANRHFSGKENGLKSDMGRIFVVYGQPDEIDDRAMDMSSKAYVIWYYYATSTGKQSFAFVDRNGDGIYDLVHSTVEEEIKNPYWMEQELR